MFALRQWRGRHEEHATPKWMRAIDAFTPVKALGMAVVLSAVNPKNLLLTVAAAAAIAQTGIAAGEQAIALAVFVVLGALGVGGPWSSTSRWASDRSRSSTGSSHGWPTTTP